MMALLWITCCPDIGGLELITEITSLMKQQMTPVLIYSAKDFSEQGKFKA